MKKLFVISLSLLLLLACCSEPEKPVATSAISYKPIVSWVKAGQVPLIYEGDTVKYSITATANADITELSVYKVDVSTKTKTLLTGYPKTNFADKRNISDQVYMPVGTKTDFKPFYLSIETKEGEAVNTKETNTYNALSEITVQRGLELNDVDIALWGIHEYKFTSNENLLPISYPYVLAFAPASNRNTKLGFSTATDSNNGIISKVYNYSSYILYQTGNFEEINSPNSIKSLFDSNKTEARYNQLNVKSNNLYLAKWNPVYNDTINNLPTYGLMKILEFKDDPLASNKDYMKFDIKLYNPYRFK